MLDARRSRRLGGSALYVAAATLIVVTGMLPTGAGWARWVGPDLLLDLTLAWVLRRPDQVPALLIALVFLLADLLTLRPPGLRAAIVVTATEAARLREHRWRDQRFLVEWLRVAVLMAGVMVADRVIQTAFFVPAALSPRAPLGQDVVALIATAGAYPLVVAAARALLGLRRMAPGEAEAG